MATRRAAQRFLASLTSSYAAGHAAGRPSAQAAAVAGVALAAAGLATPAWADADPQPAGPPVTSTPASPAHPAPAGGDATAQWRVFTDIGRDLVRQGRLQDAEGYLKRAADAARIGFGPTDPHVASACQNLAELFRLQRRYDEAAPLYESALAILAESYGPKDIRVAFALHNVAGFYLAQHQYDRAAEHYEQALQVKMATVGPGHTETSNTLFHLAEVRWAQGRHQEGIKLAKQSLDALEQQGTAESACVRRRTRLAEVLLQQGAHAEAEPLLRRVLSHFEINQGGEGAGWSAAADNLAQALQGQGRVAEAREMLQHVLTARKAQAGLRHPATASALRRVAEVELAAAAATATSSGRPAEVAQAQLSAVEAASEAVKVAESACLDAGVHIPGAAGQEAPKLAEEEGGWLSKMWSQQQASTLLRRPLRPDVAALELGNCLRVQGAVQQAVGEQQAAIAALQRAVQVLGDGWPVPAAAEGSQPRATPSVKVERLRQEASCIVLALLLSILTEVHGRESTEAAQVKVLLTDKACPQGKPV